jgi:hypothetical protein
MTRVHNDLIICTITAVFVFGVHVSKVFTELNVRCFPYIFYLSLLFLFVYVAFIMFQFRAHGGHLIKQKNLIGGGGGGKIPLFSMLSSHPLFWHMFDVMQRFYCRLTFSWTLFQPYVSYIFYCFAGVLGLIAHYLIPQLRKALPWLCCAHPVLRSREYHLYEVRGMFTWQFCF